MKGLILSGGHGTRLRPLTYSQQKQLIPVANKPILFYAIEDLIAAGIQEIGIVVGPNREQIIEAISAIKFNADISFIYQSAPKGLAHAVLISEEFIGDDPFIMYLGDNLIKGGITKYVEYFNKVETDTSILLSQVKNPTQFGVAELNEDGSVKKLIEKPKIPPSNLALVGVYLFRQPIFEAAKKIKPSWRNELEITEAIQYLIDNNFRVTYEIIKGWWKDTGKPEDIIEANQLILDELVPYNEGILEEGVQLKGRVAIGENTIIKNGCTIKGPVIIGKCCDIGPDTYIGPYTSVGNNCSIKRAEIESSIIMDGTEINYDGRIVDSLVGRDAKIRGRNNLPTGNRLILGDNSRVEIG